ncbi:MAG: molybdopterin-dependent oxidoreductase [Acidimicrobiales bacterium]|nr:molybdopterin-dependent oxidoreductase [Acidimicrobiales bacterium]
MTTPEIRHTICTLDCPDACSLAVTITDGRIVGVDASPLNEYTDNWICAKVKRTAERLYGPRRVMTPLVRVGQKGDGAFRPATWEEALGLIAERFRNSIASRGPDSIVAFTYNSSAASIERNSLTEAFFAAIGATVADHTICAAITTANWASVYDDMASADPRDVLRSRLVVVWGANPTVSNTHLAPLLQQARRAGAKIVAVDPRRTATASRADLHLAVRPGTDVVLAYAIANHWAQAGYIDDDFVATNAEGVAEFLAAASAWSIDAAAAVCGVPADDLRTLAEWWGTTKPSMLRIGWGLERNHNGGSGFRAVLALPVLGGHFGQPGAGTIGAVSTNAIDPAKRWPSFPTLTRRHVAMHQIGTWLAPGADDPCQVLFIQGSNPVVMCPDTTAVTAALSRDDVFTVVHDHVLTDTARYADVVLPATTSFELTDARSSYGSYFLSAVEPVIAPVGESRSNDQVGLAMARAHGFDWQAADVATAVADADLGPRVVEVARRQFVDTFPRSGRARLVDAVHGVPSYVPLAGREASALTLISPASSKLVNSVFGEFQSPSAAIMLHPDDAATRTLVDGQSVRVFNAQGSITTTVVISSETRPGVAVMNKGVWLERYPEGRGVNTLTPATGDPTINGACFNDAIVQVEPA